MTQMTTMEFVKYFMILNIFCAQRAILSLSKVKAIKLRLIYNVHSVQNITV